MQIIKKETRHGKERQDGDEKEKERTKRNRKEG